MRVLLSPPELNFFFFCREMKSWKLQSGRLFSFFLANICRRREILAVFAAAPRAAAAHPETAVEPWDGESLSGCAEPTRQHTLSSYLSCCKCFRSKFLYFGRRVSISIQKKYAYNIRKAFYLHARIEHAFPYAL